MRTGTIKLAAAAAVALGAMHAACAADWSDNSISYRYGTKFQEPFNGQDIKKNIVNFSHVSGYKYGSNFVSIDLLNSDSTDFGAQEAYVVYRHTLDLGKVTGKDFKFGPARGLGVTAGFDWNTKNDGGYGSRKRMLVVGPTVFLDVPGFLNVSLLALKESNDPAAAGLPKRYSYDTHAMLTAAWGIPLGATGLSFEGFSNFIGHKGKDEFGGNTAPEFNFDAQVMYDVSPLLGMGKNTLKAGLEYQYWRNKFGNDYKGPAGPGAFAKTPMVRIEYHF
ncbi:MAG TPA: outer envelope protein [Ramlibacter sp.]|nr:outer envelope protein [Ramlibacter sp.]